jgi:methionyl-tRNA formyltransferase
MKILFFGTPSFVVPVLESLAKHFDVVGVVSTPDVPMGRKKIMTPTPVKQFALDHAIPVFSLEALEDKKWTAEHAPCDLLITAAYGHLIPESVLAIPRLGSLNIHPSLLPKYRGPSPIQTAILSGDQETGISIIEMDKELDHGPIIAQESIKLHGNETFISLHEVLFKKAAELLPRTIEQYRTKSITPRRQDESSVSWCKKITKEDGYFECDNPPQKEVLDRMIRAYTPWPTAWTRIQIPNKGELVLKCLPEKMIQLEGGKPMTLKDFLNGYPQLREFIQKIF